MGEWQEVLPEDSFFNKYAVPETDEKSSVDDEDFIKPQEEKFDTILAKADGNLEKALESVMGGRQKSKNLIELAKRNIDLDFADETPMHQESTDIGPDSTVSGPVVFKKKLADGKKRKGVLSMDLEHS